MKEALEPARPTEPGLTAHPLDLACPCGSLATHEGECLECALATDYAEDCLLEARERGIVRLGGPERWVPRHRLSGAFAVLALLTLVACEPAELHSSGVTISGVLDALVWTAILALLSLPVAFVGLVAWVSWLRGRAMERQGVRIVLAAPLVLLGACEPIGTVDPADVARLDAGSAADESPWADRRQPSCSRPWPRPRRAPT